MHSERAMRGRFGLRKSFRWDYFPRSKSVRGNSWERRDDEMLSAAGSLAEISWSCWDLSCLCHWLLPSSSKPEPEEKYCMRDMSESPLQLCIHSPLVNMACVWPFEVWWLSWNRPKNLLEYLSKRQFSKNNIGCHVRVYRLHPCQYLPYSALILHGTGYIKYRKQQIIHGTRNQALSGQLRCAGSWSLGLSGRVVTK